MNGTPPCLRVAELLQQKGASENRRISVREVAEETALSYNTVQGYVQNTTRRIDVDTLVVLMAYFGVNNFAAMFSADKVTVSPRNLKDIREKRKVQRG